MRLEIDTRNSLHSAASAAVAVSILALFFPSLSCAPTPAPDVPEWSRHAIWYQIFPERFRNGDPTNDPTPADLEGAWPYEVPPEWKISPWTSDWYKVQSWETRRGGSFYENTAGRRYGGDLQGVIDKLEYLKSLGVTAIYLNPLFESPSHHKYDASMYHHIDNNFGPDPQGDRLIWARERPEDPSTWQWTAADRLFLDLISQAHLRGIKVVIDGVFNHVGARFWAFQDVRKQGQASAYRDWFTVTSWDDPSTPKDEFDYEGWMGVKDLPELREDASGIVKGPREHIHAVVRRWMDPNGDGNPSDGIDGWRLDVAEKVAIPFWREFRTWVRGINPQAYITGEVWWEDWQEEKMFNAAPWLQGDVFDAVMNYRWAREACRFFKDSANAITPSEFDRRIHALLADYPSEVNYVLMNLYGSHDTDRLASMIVNVDSHFDKNIIPRDNPAYGIRKPTREERQVQRLMVLFQMTSLGAPMVYYGDEAGMWGSDDPDCRKPMVWPEMTFAAESHDPLGRPRNPDENAYDSTMAHYYRSAVALRRDHLPLRSGTLTTLLTDDAQGLYVFLRSQGDEHVVVALNRSDKTRQFSVPLPDSVRKLSWTSVFQGGSPVASPEGLACTLEPVSGSVFVNTVK